VSAVVVGVSSPVAVAVVVSAGVFVAAVVVGPRVCVVASVVCGGAVVRVAVGVEGVGVGGRVGEGVGGDSFVVVSGPVVRDGVVVTGGVPVLVDGPVGDLVGVDVAFPACGGVGVAVPVITGGPPPFGGPGSNGESLIGGVWGSPGASSSAGVSGPVGVGVAVPRGGSAVPGTVTVLGLANEIPLGRATVAPISYVPDASAGTATVAETVRDSFGGIRLQDHECVSGTKFPRSSVWSVTTQSSAGSPRSSVNPWIAVGDRFSTV
jgi:hypothetical protein